MRYFFILCCSVSLLSGNSLNFNIYGESPFIKRDQRDLKLFVFFDNEGNQSHLLPVSKRGDNFILKGYNCEILFYIKGKDGLEEVSSTSILNGTSPIYTTELKKGDEMQCVITIDLSPIDPRANYAVIKLSYPLGVDKYSAKCNFHIM